MAVRGLPAGLVTASEEALGLLVAESRCVPLINEDVAYAFSLCRPWDRLYAIIRELSDGGAYSQTNVIERCQEIDVCDLVGRCSRCTAGIENREEAFLRVRDRIRLELDLLRSEELDRKAGAEKLSASDEVFDLARGQTRGPISPRSVKMLCRSNRLRTHLPKGGWQSVPHASAAGTGAAFEKVAASETNPLAG